MTGAGYDSGLALYANGAVPSDSTGGIAMTNATTYLGSAEAYALPKLAYEVSSGVSLRVRTRDACRSARIEENGMKLDVSTLPLWYRARRKFLPVHSS